MGEIRSRGHVAAQSSWAPKKPSATAVHDTLAVWPTLGRIAAGGGAFRGWV